MRLDGSCQCGAVRFSVDSGEPYPYQRCYCSICRKTAGGGGYAVNIGGDADSLEVEGQEHVSVHRAQVEREGEVVTSSHERHFCVRCGSHLWAFNPRWPSLVHPVAGALDTEVRQPPGHVHMMVGSKAPWAEVEGRPGDARFEGYPEESLASWHEARGLTGGGAPAPHASPTLPTRLETGRVILRPPRLEDAEALFEEYCTDPEVVRYATWAPHSGVEDTRAFLAGCLADWSRGDRRFAWVIALKSEDGRPVGMVDMTREGHAISVGYVLTRRLWARGITSEAARCATQSAWKLSDIRRVWASTDVDNQASARVLEKLGMEREGVLRRWIVRPNLGREPRDSLIYARVR